MILRLKAIFGYILVLIGVMAHIYCVEILKNYMFISWLFALYTYIVGVKIIEKNV